LVVESAFQAMIATPALEHASHREMTCSASTDLFGNAQYDERGNFRMVGRLDLKIGSPSYSPGLAGRAGRWWRTRDRRQRDEAALQSRLAVGWREDIAWLPTAAGAVAR
jgi:hypothetical protein